MKKWLVKLLGKVESFASLEPGWDSYTAEAPTATARELAKTMLEAMAQAGIRPDHVGPSVVGGIGISLDCDDRSSYVEFYNDGQACVLLDDGRDPPDIRRRPTGRASLTELAELVGDFIHGKEYAPAKWR